MNKKRLVSGIKPTGRPHLGNYFGALKQFVELQDSHESFFMIADLHALTTLRDAEKLSDYTRDLLIDYLAIGINPETSVVFKQSDVPPHTELAWVFNCLVTVPFLSRSHAYKSALDEGIAPSAGLLTYPMLQAADILLYSPDIVPVGRDQKQHIEYARDVGEKFNLEYGETFKLPEALILESVETISGTDGRKMSKSYGNHIPLFSTDEEIEKSIMGIVTASKEIGEPLDPSEDVVFSFHRLLSDEKTLEELEKRYRNGDIGFKESKELLIEKMKKLVAPLREKRRDIEEDEAYIHSVLENGARKAKEIAQEKMTEVRKRVGTREK